MKSKVWKSLLLAPALITLLSGCGGNSSHPKSSGPTATASAFVTPYAGVWGSSKRLSLYRSSFQKHHHDYQGFCNAILSDPQGYGVDSNHVVLNSFVIQANGEADSYNVSVNPGQLSLNRHFWGNIDEDGVLQASNANYRVTSPNAKILVVDKIVFKGPTPELIYLSSDEQELTDYASAALSCLNESDSGSTNDGKTNQPNVPPQDNGNSFDVNAS